MKFAYSQLPTITSLPALAPLVPVTFIYKNIEFPTFALVDSGAAGAVISTVIADGLGIEWDKIPRSVGFTLSGQFISHFVSNVEATIDDFSFSLGVSIVEGASPYHCILGQKDLFQNAKITFAGYKKEFEVLFRENN